MHYTRLLILLLVLTTAACDSAESVDDDPTATKVALTLENETSSDTVAWSAETAIGLVDGVALTKDTLVLTSGMTFNGRIKLYDVGGKDLTVRIQNEAERYQLFYDVSNLGRMRINVEDTETNYGTNDFGINLPVGLNVSFTTPAAESTMIGSLRVRVGYFPPGAKNGFTLTIDPIYDFIIPVRIEPVAPPPEPPAPPVVTRFRLDLERQDELKTIAITAGDRVDGLNFHGVRLPPALLDIEVCERDSVEVAFACEKAEALTVVQREHFSGRVTVSDRERGEDFTEHVRAIQEEYRIFYELPFSPTGLTFDEDANGDPVGLEIDWELPTGIQIGNGNLILQMYEYDRDWGGDKVRLISTAKLLDFAVPFNLDRP